MECITHRERSQLSAYAKFYFRPGRGEQTETTVTPVPDEKSAICGRVTDSRGAPVPDALVLLFDAAESAAPTLLARFCTDEDGHFFFGPLESERLYMINLFKNTVKMRELEIVADE